MDSTIHLDLLLYEDAPRSQKIINYFLQKGELYFHHHTAHEDIAQRRAAQMRSALTQNSTIEAITSHAYTEVDEYNYTYGKAATKLEEAITRNFCRVALSLNNPSQTVDKMVEMVNIYRREVLGKMTDQSLEGCKALFFLDQTKEDRDKNLTPAEKKRLKAVGQEIEYNPQDAEELWTKNTQSDEIKSYEKIAKQSAITTYSEIMQPIMESIGRTAYKTRDYIRVAQTINNFALPEVTAFLGTCNSFGMSKSFPPLIAAAARKNNILNLEQEMPTFKKIIQEKRKKEEQKFWEELEQEGII